MDVWQTICHCCKRTFRVRAYFEAEALTTAKESHDEDQKKDAHFQCNPGPLFTTASNITHPRPRVVRGW